MKALPMEQTPVVISKRYTLEGEIGQGGMGVVYRAYDRLSRQSVALKRVSLEKWRGDFVNVTSTSQRLNLAKEFRTLAGLRHPNIISVLDYGFDDARQPYYTMELLEEAQPIVTYAQNLPRTGQMRLILQMCQALLYLHRRGILHRDLKGDNVQVVGGQVKVLDFGLAILADNPQESEDMGGTLAYMPPEVLLGGNASHASDLYAVGVLMCEILTGRYPYAYDTVTALMHAVLTQAPQVDIDDDGLRAVMERLLSKEPQDRYTRVQDLIANLDPELRGRVSVDARESFLQRADFVGRDRELNRLLEALDTIRAGGTGAFWLVSGEGGVGKSRLMEEFSANALVSGALVLRLQAKASEGALAMWREALRQLALEVELTPEEAQVLKLIVADIGDLIGRDVPDAPQLDPQSARARLQAVLMSIFARLTRPCVLIAEDLHEIDGEFILLSAFASWTSRYPLLGIATYRQEERPQLHESLKHTHRMTLDRLDRQQIARLSASMLGDGGRNEAVVDFLERETEGNAFFMVEVVRVLAEEVGALENIGQTTLPQSVFAGGIHRVVTRRLGLVASQDNEALAWSAVVGRVLDLELLRASGTVADVDGWLTRCADLAILSVNDGKWLFAHDKLREGVLSGLLPAQKQALHQRIAQTMESVYPRRADLLAPLIYHWGLAGDRAKQAHYARIGGEQALRTGSNRLAVQWLTLAVDYARETGAPAQERAYLAQQLGQVYLALGDMDNTGKYSLEALRTLGLREYKGSPVQTLGQLLRQVRTHFLGLPKQTLALDAVRVGSIACRQMAQMYFYNNRKPEATFYVLQGLNVAEQGGENALKERSLFYTNMGLAMGVVPLPTLAERYYRMAKEAAHTLGDPDAQSWAGLVWGIYAIGRADWAKARAEFDLAISLSRQMGNRRRYEECLGMVRYIELYTGEIDALRTVNDEYYALALTVDNAQAQVAALSMRMLLALRDDDVALVSELMGEADALLPQMSDLTILTYYYGLRAQVHLRRGDFERALMDAEEVHQLILGFSPTAYYMREGHLYALDVFVELHERTGDDSYRERVERTMNSLRRYTKVFPIGAPMVSYYEGQLHRLQAQPDLARQKFQQAQAQAKAMGMVLDLQRVEKTLTSV